VVPLSGALFAVARNAERLAGLLDRARWAAEPPRDCNGPRATTSASCHRPDPGAVLLTNGSPVGGATAEAKAIRVFSERDSSGRDQACVVTGVAGQFDLGKLRIQSLSYPRFITSGLTLEAGEVLDVEVMIDHGDQQLTGRVTDEAGQPLAGVDLTLSWVLRDGVVVHESLRKTTTDRAGAFVFTRLGAGERDLIARAPNHEPVRLGGVSPSGTEQVIIELPTMVQP
jgi:hypothetical protein